MLKLTKRDAVVGGAAIILTASVFGTAIAKQPHMTRAIDYLNAAKSELRLANNNKGGHRVRAMKFVDDAIAEAKKGINEARS